MPELHGQPFKHQLRKQISELRRENWNLLKEKLRLSPQLRYSRCKVEELEARIERMKQFLRAAIVEADREVGPATFKRFEESFRSDFDRAATG
jgi:hypothetical protein